MLNIISSDNPLLSFWDENPSFIGEMKEYKEIQEKLNPQKGTPIKEGH